MQRTDLACESAGLSRAEGVVQIDRRKNGFKITEVDITSESASAKLGKSIGKYITVELDDVLRREDEAFLKGAEAVGAELASLLQLKEDSSVLVVGLGNDAIAADSIGPLTLKSTIVTRHLRHDERALFSINRKVSAVESGVSAATGIESAELVRAAADAVRPDAVIAVDALASLSPDRICRIVQLSNTGIVPGSGVNNARKALDSSTLGAPVIAVGVPTIIEAETLAVDITRQTDGREIDEKTQTSLRELIVTSRDIDCNTKLISKLVGYAINIALHEKLSPADFSLFLE